MDVVAEIPILYQLAIEWCNNYEIFVSMKDFEISKKLFKILHEYAEVKCQVNEIH